MTARVVLAAKTKAAEICSKNNFELHEFSDPIRLRLRGSDQQAVQLGLQMIKQHIGVAIQEEKSDIELAEIVAELERRRRPSIGQWIINKIRRGGSCDEDAGGYNGAKWLKESRST